MKPDFLAHDLLNAALEQFQRDGYDQVDLGDIAGSVGCTLDELYARFPRKESFVMALYRRTAQGLHANIPDAPASSVAVRFQFMMRKLFAELKPHRTLLRCLLPAMLNPEDRLGVLGPATDHIRAEVQAVYQLLVLGADNCPSEDEVERLVQLLYFAHLGLIFLFLQDQRDDDEFIDNNILLAGDLITVGQRTLVGKTNWFVNQLAELAGLPRVDHLRERVTRLVKDYTHPPHDSTHFSVAENILRDLFRFRRLQPGFAECEKSPCPQCLALHLPRVERAVGEQQPLSLVLPAFPAKSANPKKVSGPLPDFGEELALRFLQDRCDDITAKHQPGAQLTICSDGRVFSDLVGVSDKDVTAYRLCLMEMIEQLELESLQVFDLDDVMPGVGFEEMRVWLMEKYGEPREELERRTAEHEHHRQLFNGIHRFMFEDLAEREPALSRTQARKKSKDTAYEVIRRSNAWSKVVSEFFPDSLRLSIHPHAAHSDKVGILLGDADDLWLTPWHGVALLEAERFSLTRREAAEERGAKLVQRDGRPSHFEVAQLACQSSQNE